MEFLYQFRRFHCVVFSAFSLILVCMYFSFIHKFVIFLFFPLCSAFPLFPFSLNHLGGTLPSFHKDVIKRADPLHLSSSLFVPLPPLPWSFFLIYFCLFTPFLLRASFLLSLLLFFFLFFFRGCLFPVSRCIFPLYSAIFPFPSFGFPLPLPLFPPLPCSSASRPSRTLPSR